MFGTFSRRIVLFVLTNLAVVVLIGVILRVLGVDELVLGGGSLSFWGLLALAAGIGFGGSLISLLLSKPLALLTTGGQIIDRPRTQTEAWLLETVARQASDAGIGIPDVAVYDSPDPNAFATGAFRNRALVAVSTGLMEVMDRREVEAVLGHEVSHVANGDMITLSLMQGVVNTFVIFLSRVVGMLVDQLLFRGQDDEHPGPVLGPGYWLTVIVCELLFGVFATALVMWFSRRREFAADLGSAQLGGAAPMIAALERLRRVQDPTELPPALTAFGIRGGGRGLARLFLSHPSLEERIAELRKLQAQGTASRQRALHGGRN